MTGFTDNEPAITSGIVAMAAAIIALLVAFNVPITQQQRDAIMGAIGVGAPMLAVLIARNFVMPTAKAAALIHDATLAQPAPVAPAAPPVIPPAT